MSWAEYSALVDKVIERRRQMCVDLAALHPRHGSLLRDRLIDLFRDENAFNRINRGLRDQCASSFPPSEHAMSEVRIWESMASLAHSAQERQHLRERTVALMRILQDVLTSEGQLEGDALTLRKSVDQLIEDETRLGESCRSNSVGFSPLYVERMKGYYDFADHTVRACRESKERDSLSLSRAEEQLRH